MKYSAQLDLVANDTYRYLNFDQIKNYTDKADKVIAVKEV